MGIDFTPYLELTKRYENLVKIDMSKYKKTKSEQVSFDEVLEPRSSECEIVVTETCFDPNIFRVDLTDAEAVFYAALYGGPLY